MKPEANKLSKQLILDAATAVFAEKGFDGARVDEIARRAGVNKALIYYYFESKDKILEELMEGIIKDLIEFKDGLAIFMEDINPRQFFDSQILDEILRKYFNFARKHRPLLNIIMTEAMKETASKNVFFQMLNMFVEDNMNRTKMLKGKIMDYESFRISVIFLAYMPMFNFITLGEKWAEYNGVDYATAEDKYLQIFKNLYYDYFLTKIFRIDFD